MGSTSLYWAQNLNSQRNQKRKGNKNKTPQMLLLDQWPKPNGKTIFPRK